PTLALSADSASYSLDSVATIDNTTNLNGGDDVNAWQIDWGDGDSGYFTGNPSSFTHDYTTPGSFSPTATAFTDDGSYSNSFGVNITDAATFSLSAPFSLPDNQTYFLTETFADPGSSQQEASWQIFWGDGKEDEYNTAPNYLDTFPHIYATHGVMAVT